MIHKFIRFYTFRNQLTNLINQFISIYKSTYKPYVSSSTYKPYLRNHLGHRESISPLNVFILVLYQESWTL